MYEFTCKPPGPKVILWDDAGNEIGAAVFQRGHYVTDDETAAKSLLHAAETLPEYGITLVAAPEPEPEPELVAPAEGEDAPAHHQRKKGK